MAIKTSGTTPIEEYAKLPKNPNAMIIEMTRTGLLYYFDKEKIVLLRGREPTITNPNQILFPGKVIYDFVEKAELLEILEGDGDRYQLEHITETVRVVTRFCL